MTNDLFNQEKKTKTLALFDLGYIFRRNWHAWAEDDSNKARHETIKYVAKHAGDYNLVALCADAPPYERKKWLPEYKGQREKTGAGLVGQLERTIAELQRWGYEVAKVQGWEADDVIATLARQASGLDIAVHIYTADKDCKQCLQWGKYTEVIDPQNGVSMDALQCLESEKYGVKPSQIPDWLAIVGDKSDNIPGLNGVGEKTAAKWLKFFDTIENLITGYAMENSPLTPKQREKFTPEIADRLRLGLRLTTLNSELPIELSAVKGPVKPIPQESQELEPIDAPAPEPQGAVSEPVADAPEPEVIPATKPTPAAPSESTAIVPAKPVDVSWERALEPMGIDPAWKLANNLNRSRLWTHKFDGPEQHLAAILVGRMYGVGAAVALQNFKNIKGRVSMSSEFMVGMVLNSPLCEYLRFVDGDEKSATWVGKRRGSDNDPVTLTYTFKEAEQAGYTATRGRDGSWQKQPKVMLRWRCATTLCRLLWPDVTAGMYAIEEVEDFA